MTRVHIFQKTTNVLVYLFFLSATAYVLIGRTKLADVLYSYETYFRPATWIFSVWSLIHLLLGGFMIYQWFEPAHEAAIQGVGWHFIISAILSVLWYSLLENDHAILALIASIFLVSAVSFVFYNLEKNYPTTSWWDKLFVHAPFSLWHGWSVFMAVVTAFAALTRVRKNDSEETLPPNVLHTVLVYIALVFLTAVAIGYVEYKHKKGDLTSSWMIALGLWAVFDEQRFPVIRWGALGAAIVSTLWPAKPYIYRLLGRGPSSGEAAPLLA